MSSKRKQEESGRKRERGQGLVEFALVLPALLLTLMGIADFGRMFAVYSNLFNAAREGARYGIVNPKDVYGISLTTRNTIKMVEAEDVDVYVHFDSGPGTPIKDYSTVGVGDRVIVTLNADVEMITPLIRAIAEQLSIETSATRTISTISGVGSGGDPPAPPTATPDGTTTPSPTPTLFTIDTPTPTVTGTPDPVFTPSPTPNGVPIEITIPLWDGDTTVIGTAQADQVVFLRDIQDPAFNFSTTVNGDGTFQFNLPSGLIAGHVIAVQGYGTIDYAIVEGLITPTATPTPTAVPTLTPTPVTEYIDIEPTCGPEGTPIITVIGHQWPVDKGEIFIFWDGVAVERVNPPSPDFSVEIPVITTNGIHEVRAATELEAATYNDSKSFEVPCAVTPTPTPGQPNLIIESMGLENQGDIATYDPLTFTVAVRNAGAAAANSLFWVDLYADPAVEPPLPADLASEVSIAWVAVSALADSETMSLTLNYPEGFTTLGDHRAYAFADSWDQILESDELDNVGGPVTVTVLLEGVPPTPTPTPTPGAVPAGAISGSTWLYINGDVVPQGRVDVYCYSGGELITETSSDELGDYLIDGLAPGTYTIIGQTIINDVLYSDVVLNVVVVSGQTTEYITLVLH